MSMASHGIDEFHQDYSFTRAQTEATYGLWYAVLARQPDMKKWLPTFEQIAFNLREHWVSLDFIRVQTRSQ